MHILFAIIKKDFQLILKKPLAIISLFLLPLAFFGIIHYGYSDVLYKDTFIAPFDVLILDKENTTQSTFLINQLKQTSIFENLRVTHDLTAQDTFSKLGIPALIIIPENFTTTTSIGENLPITLLGNPDFPIQVSLVENIVKSTTNLITAGQSAINTYYSFSEELGVPQNELNSSFQQVVLRTMFLTLSRWDIFKEISQEGLYNLNISFYILAASITVFMGFNSLPLMKMILEDRYHQMNQRFRSAKVPFITSLFSKLLFTLLLTLLQFFALYLLTRYLLPSGTFVNFHLMRLLVLIFLGVFSFTGFISLIMAFSSSYPTADIVGNLSLFVMAILGGCIYPLSSLPQIFLNFGQNTIHGTLLNGFLMLFFDSQTHFSRVFIPLFLWGIVSFSASNFLFNLRRDFQ
jgi:hypothetical protein